MEVFENKPSVILFEKETSHLLSNMNVKINLVMNMALNRDVKTPTISVVANP